MELKADAPARARERFEQALALARALGDRWTEGLALGSLGEALLGLGRLDEARTRLRASRALARELGDRQSEGAAEGDLAALLPHGGAPDARASTWRAACTSSSEIGDRRGEAYAEYLRGLIGLQEGDTQHAVEHLELAQEIAHAVRGRRRGAWATLRLAEVAEAAGRPARGPSTGRGARSRPVARSVRRACRRSPAAASRSCPGATSAPPCRHSSGGRRACPWRIASKPAISSVKATGQREHLHAAWRWIEVLRAAAPAECRADVDAVRRHRAVRDALDASVE